MPKRAYALAGALVAFAVLVFGVLAWAGFSGRAGSQRGLVIHSELREDSVVCLGSGACEQLGPERDQAAFVVKRDEFPQTFVVRDVAGAQLFERRFEYAYLADADFRISYDTRGFYPTTLLREPAASPTP